MSAVAEDAERERVTFIRELARRARLPDEWAQALIDAGTTVRELRRCALECHV